MCIQSTTTGTWKLLIAVKVSVGLVPAVTPRILCYFIYFYESCHKVFSSGWHGEQGAFWAGWKCQQCFQQAHAGEHLGEHPGEQTPVLQGSTVNLAHSHPLWDRGTVFRCLPCCRARLLSRQAVSWRHLLRKSLRTHPHFCDAVGIMLYKMITVPEKVYWLLNHANQH